ncbi:hypothetical protein GJU00_01930 [Enterobacteriaceae endosymbiont of Donacia simplex]|uniref:S4 domain-containing protein n=1 Tax=Enterobacteriaceae endosymbiont of Donacia simplex TaxID=2675784 RepID=UPI0014497929|nr:S4 domain-containing protein [Enterobacteriaceae endosymbiont of Donacia simplex]QJC36664.1 hypothetical protein GJU00_01930 [Enterobacteriaceae endosymbiont of Donacia simplex]
MKSINLILKVCLKYDKKRLDLFLTKKIIQFSRSQIKKIILNNKVKINDFIINIPKKKFFLKI